MRHTHAGTITSIGDDYSSPDHVNISVKHGPKPRKKKAKKGDGNSVGMGFNDNRPSSNFAVPRAHAKHYSVGQSVDLGIGPTRLDPETKFRRTMSKMTSRKGC